MTCRHGETRSAGDDRDGMSGAIHSAMPRNCAYLLCAITLLEGCAPRPSERCGGCAEELECRAVTRTGLLVRTYDEHLCTLSCAFDRDCAALWPTAYCAFSELCLVECETTEECPGGARCIGGICGAASSEPAPDQPSIGDVGLRLALGAHITWWPDDLPCGDVGVFSEPPGVVDVRVVEWGDRPDCVLSVEASARAVGHVELILTRAGAELARRPFQVERAASLSIGRSQLFTHSVDRMDLSRLETPGLLLVTARSADGERLGVGVGARWSVDTPSAASLAPWADTGWSEPGYAILHRAAGGSGTLSVDVGGVTHSIPFEL